MEDDRAQTNLGPGVEDEVPEDIPAVTKQPKRRFVGRKTATDVNNRIDPNTNIEDSSAIQGLPTLVVPLAR